MSELGRVRDKASWRDTLLSVLRAWNRHQVWKILTAIVVIWIVSGIALHFAERGTNPAFETLHESLWNVWVTLFSGLNDAPNTRVGRLVVSGVLVVGVMIIRCGRSQVPWHPGDTALQAESHDCAKF